MQDTVARSRPVKQYADAVWPALDAARVVMDLLGDPAALAAAADGVLDDGEQALLRWDAPVRGPRTAPWTAADAVLVDEVADLLQRTTSLGHVVLDEAQDLSPMQPARRRTPVLDRFDDRAGRHRAGHHAVVDPLVGRVARPPRAARRARRGA
nr:hypothetical protein [Angustibacter aerolatus]